MFAASKRKIADQGPTPDNEDVFEVGSSISLVDVAHQGFLMKEDEPVPEDTSEKADEDDDEVNDLAKDRLIKALKPKGMKGKEKGAKKT